jgi:hypothetical protein
MYLRLMTGVGVVWLLALAVLPPTEAAPRRFGRRSTSSYSYSSSGGIKQVAPKSDPAASGYRALGVYYSYDKALDDQVAFADRIRVHLLVKDAEVLNARDPVVAEVKMFDLSDRQSSRVRYFPVTFDRSAAGAYKLGVFDIANAPDEEPIVEPATVYRMFVNLHRESAEYGPESALGKVATAYYVATSGENRLDRARQHIAMRTFKEFYYAQHGWRSEEQYPMDCYAYYMWATGSCTVGAQNGRTILGRLFGHRRPFQNGSHIVNLAGRGAIHGDYVRIPGHSFMLLAYDPNARHVWTMEGNFNSTIEVVVRSVDTGWTVGHLVDEHIQPGLFEVSRAAAREDPTRSRR